MSTAASTIVDQRPAAGGKPSVTFRQAGDRALLIEYGEMKLDLGLNFLVLAFDKALGEHPVEGLIETAPGFRTMLVSYDPLRLETGDLVDHLRAVHDELPEQGDIEIPSRTIEMPIALDDSQTRGAVERYIHSIRRDAPNCEGGNNIDYIVRCNGLADRDEFYEQVLSTEYWTGFIGFFPGLPFMFPTDPRNVVVVPKYNPTRTWTPEGAVGIGGPCFAIYPVESPGGYQVFGRSIPVYDLQKRNAAFRDDELLLRPADRVRFHQVSEEELMSLFEDVRADRYVYPIEEQVFDVGEYMRSVERLSDETDERARRREQASAATPVP